jgi:hypothetical protein
MMSPFESAAKLSQRLAGCAAFLVLPLAGFAQETSSVVPYTAAPLTLDGEIDTVYSDVLGVIDYAPEEAVTLDPSELRGTWRGAFDGDNLYLLVDVVDDAWVNDLSDVWINDGVEVFLDGDNSKGSSVDNVNDIKIAFVPQTDGSVLIDLNVWPANPTGLDFSNVEAAFALRSNDATYTGYRLEVKIPLNLPSISAEAGGAFGVDFQINDNDAGEDREHFATLSGEIPNNRPDLYATAELGTLPDHISVTGVAVSPTAFTLYVDESRMLEVTVSPGAATTKGVTWSSEDTDVATVNAAGVVTAVAAGTTTVRATTEDGGFVAESTVTVAAQEGLASVLGAASTGNPDEFESDWFGVFREGANYGGWIWHEGLGWLYGQYVTTTASMWFWSLEFNAWIYTSQQLFPHLWVEGEGWSYYALTEWGGGYRFDYGLARWLRVARPTHPYLYFTAADIPQIRADLAKPEFAAARAQFLSRASVVLNGSPPSPDEVARTNLANCGIAAFAYILTGEVQYAERAIEEVVDMADQPDLWTTPGFDAWNRGADLESSERSLGAALVYDWCYDVMTPEERAKVRNAIIERGLKPYYLSIDPSLAPNWWVDDPTNNWRGVCNGGSSVAALALYYESDVARRTAHLAYDHVASALEALQLVDSGGHEGADYNNYGVEFALKGGVALQRFFGGYEDLLVGMADDHLGSYWEAYLYAPDNHFANFGRMPFSFNQAGPNTMRAALYDSLTPGGDLLMRWAADTGTQRFYWNGANPFDLLWRRRGAPRLTEGDKPELQDAVLFRGAGHAVIQSDSLWLGFSGGLAWNRGDVGAFVLLARNGGSWERLISLEPSLSDGNLESAAQSTYLVGGSGQVRGEFNRSGEYLKFGSGTDYHYLACDISDLYSASALTQLVRHFVVVRGRYVVILDDTRASQSLSFETRFQTDSGNSLELGTKTATIRGGSNDLYIINSGFDNFSQGEGTIGALRYASFRRTDFRGALLTVLYPAAKSGSAPTVTVQDGVVTIDDGTTSDELVFVRESNTWQLTEVNGESTAEIGTGAERSVVPIRQSRDDAEVPSWILKTVR